MPCYDRRDSPEWVARDTRERLTKEFRHNSEVAELLCEVLTYAENRSSMFLWELSPAVMKWWEEHKERDSQQKEDR